MTKGARIKQLREAKGLTQEELAKLLNTTKQTVSKYEKEIVTNIPSDRIENMAKILDTTPEYILGWEKVQKNNDIMADIVIRMRVDSDFLSVVEKLNAITDAEQLRSVERMLSAFLK